MFNGMGVARIRELLDAGESPVQLLNPTGHLVCSAVRSCYRELREAVLEEGAYEKRSRQPPVDEVSDLAADLGGGTLAKRRRRSMLGGVVAAPPAERGRLCGTPGCEQPDLHSGPCAVHMAEPGTSRTRPAASPPEQGGGWWQWPARSEEERLQGALSPADLPLPTPSPAEAPSETRPGEETHPYSGEAVHVEAAELHESDAGHCLSTLAHRHLFSRCALDDALGVEMVASARIEKGAILCLLSGRFMVGLLRSNLPDSAPRPGDSRWCHRTQATIAFNKLATERPWVRKYALSVPGDGGGVLVGDPRRDWWVAANEATPPASHNARFGACTPSVCQGHTDPHP